MPVNEADDCTLKKFTFSYSALKDWSTCPKRFYETRIAHPRIYPEAPSPALQEGNEIHESLAHCLRTGDKHEKYQHWVDKFNSIPGKMIVEEKLAITRNFEPVYWFNNAAWYRVVIDAAKINSDYALALDWKTGASRNVPDNLQLTLTALALFVHYPDIKMVGTRYVWLKEGVQTKHLIKYEDIGSEWGKILPLVGKLEEAHRTQNFPPRPNRLCRRFCPVRTCQYWGK